MENNNEDPLEKSLGEESIEEAKLKEQINESKSPTFQGSKLRSHILEFTNPMTQVDGGKTSSTKIEEKGYKILGGRRVSRISEAEE